MPAPEHTPPIRSGTGYANLTDGNSFSGDITVYADWVHINTENGAYTVPRRRIDFINWKEV